MKESTVKSDKGFVVIKGSTLNGSMEGECIWYDGTGKPILNGIFRDGKPFSGTFVDWSLEFKELKSDPFEPKEYAKDWVTFMRSPSCRKKSITPRFWNLSRGENNEYQSGKLT